ncbi:hypothetical protein C6Y40_06525 [Alteromonas alba]|jgi:hypothetical protein|uniref:Uncharacterized protein n=1 Tax=Alteromonas alba TaxID=2079529 RepID=A0A2S9VDN9_9ALTE|nr:hypothetical protein C6Y40_06525 [Alteromonas alba]
MELAVIRLKDSVYCRNFSDLSGLAFFSARTCQTFFVHQPLKRAINLAKPSDEMSVDEFIDHFHDGQLATVNELEARGLLVRV